jgi:hypothetical protein
VAVKLWDSGTPHKTVACIQDLCVASSGGLCGIAIVKSIAEHYPVATMLQH